jgi:hypothetical protein
LEAALKMVARRSSNNPLASAPTVPAGSIQPPRVKRMPEKVPRSRLPSPRSTTVPGWPMPPAVLRAGKPVFGLPVVTIGTGRGVFFTHHRR